MVLASSAHIQPTFHPNYMKITRCQQHKVFATVMTVGQKRKAGILDGGTI